MLKTDRIRALARLTTAATGVSFDMIRGPSQRRYITRAREFFAYHARWFGYSYPEIGRIMRKDHSSVIYFVKHYKGLVQ